MTDSHYYAYLGGTAPDPGDDEITWAMFSPEGAAAVQALVNEVSLNLTTQGEQALVGLRKKVEEIAKTHCEVFDTAVRETVLGSIDTALETVGIALDRQADDAWYGEGRFA